MKIIVQNRKFLKTIKNSMNENENKKNDKNEKQIKNLRGYLSKKNRKIIQEILIKNTLINA